MNHPAKSMLTGSNLQSREASCGYFSYSGSDETLVSRIRNNGDKHKGTKKPWYKNHLSREEQVTPSNASLYVCRIASRNLPIWRCIHGRHSRYTEYSYQRLQQLTSTATGRRSQNSRITLAAGTKRKICYSKRVQKCNKYYSGLCLGTFSTKWLHIKLLKVTPGWNQSVILKFLHL